ncbi:putative serine protease K12H4.7 [Limulus polyphemus]|uniref:Serine protease K12H4.7 n=1 Tax=Limulus polyphemus TaxID=6850 RepID=A0ABM1BB53_LIMPO|nr:putative serine protease K12H4.7 [Limulus polyphemus]
MFFSKNSTMFIYLFLLVFGNCVDGKKMFLGGPRHWSSKLRLADVKQSLPAEQWVVQKLDHFNPANTETWKQRYFINDTFYRPGGPVFLQIGGEGKANPIWMIEGQWIKYASKFRALAVMVEHRFYGKSHPTTDMSVKNLVYLSSEQALADLAYFRNFLSNKLGLQKSKWIAFGGSYPGSLAAWFRLKYPHLVDGAVASSAPFLAKIDFKEYLGVVRESLATSGKACNTEIKKAVDLVEKLLQHQVGWQMIEKTFKLCDQFNATIEKDVSNFFSSLVEQFEDVVQYNKDNRDFEGSKATNITIDTLCSIMNNTSKGSPLQRLGKVNSLILETYGEKCLDHRYENTIREMRNLSWNSSAAEGGRQWTYQTCVEFGYFQTSNLKDQPFGHHFPTEFFTQMCSDIFGPKYSKDLVLEGIDRTNTMYGGKDLKVTNVVFPNGSIDPWHALGIIKDLSPSAVAIFINGSAHCADMYPDSPNDPPQLQEARLNIENHIAKWLQHAA